MVPEPHAAFDEGDPSTVRIGVGGVWAKSEEHDACLSGLPSRLKVRFCFKKATPRLLVEIKHRIHEILMEHYHNRELYEEHDLLGTARWRFNPCVKL